MSKITRKSIDTTIENNIVTASILSTQFLNGIVRVYSQKYIRNSFAGIVMNWVLDYYANHGEAPKQSIQSIYELEKGNLDEAEDEIVRKFLTDLSKRYTEEQEVNYEYILDKAMAYFRKREVELRVDTAQKLIEVGKFDLAERELMEMKQVVRDTSDWSNPLEGEDIFEVFDDTKKGAFRFPGMLGDLYGDLERGWLVAILASFKRGKTWSLQEPVVMGAFCGLKTVFVSLEMKKKNLHERIYKRITAFGDVGKNEHIIPVFDCKHNQLGTCADSARTNQEMLYDSTGKPEFDKHSSYRPCTVCMNDRAKKGNFEVETWFEVVEKPEFNLYNVTKKLRAFNTISNNSIRTITYPRFSASVADIERDLDMLEQTEGFIPDIIAIDYADILKSSRSNGDTRIDIDTIWKELAAMAAKRKVIMFTASQGNRAAIYKPNMDQSDLAEWVGKLAHVDIFTCLNQTPEEKKKGIMRVGILAHRHKEFHEQDQCWMLQALSLGQTHLDSFMEVKQ